jgi:hypothetical protein
MTVIDRVPNTLLACAVLQAFRDVLHRDGRINFAKLLESEAVEIPRHIGTGQASAFHSRCTSHNIWNGNNSPGHVRLSFIKLGQYGSPTTVLPPCALPFVSLQLAEVTRIEP